MKGNISKNNTIELSVFGKLDSEILNLNSSKRNLFYSLLYEIFENDYHSFMYNVTTYQYFNKEEFSMSPVSNLVEVYQRVNVDGSHDNKVIDTDKFYEKITFANDLEEFLLISPFFIKYVSSNFVKKPSCGNAKIVELARCEENMPLILEKLGYREKRKIIYGGEMIKFGKENILLSVFYINPNFMNPNDRTGLLKGVELSAFCLDSEIENYSSKLKSIMQKLEK